MENRDLLGQTAQIVSSHLANNAVPQDQVPALIREVFKTLTGLGGLIISGQGEPETAVNPAVPIRLSVKPDHIVCLEDGKKLKMLKRHLMTSYNMTPEQYRKKWGLPHDYPMVAPNYAETRSSLAKQNGLGRHREPIEDRRQPRFGMQGGERATPAETGSGPSVRRIPEGVSGKKLGRPRRSHAA